MWGKGGNDMLKVSEVAEALRLSEYTVRDYLKQGKIKGIKIGGGWRVTLEALDQYIKEISNE